MEFELKTLSWAAAASEKCDALVVLVPTTHKPANDALSRLLTQAVTAKDFEPKAGRLLGLYRAAEIEARRTLLVGVGEGLDAGVRSGVLAALQSLKGTAAKRVVLVLSGLPDSSAGAVRAAMLAAADATYVFTTTKPKAEARSLQRVIVGVADAAKAKAAHAGAAAAIAGIEFAKEWGNRPANHGTPTLLAGAAKELGKLPGISCEVLGPKEVARLGMGSFMAVAKGSDEPLRFIVLKYMGGAKAQAPAVLVGKGITFDTGGISIKPAGEMDEMKFDMCGAASVLGVFRALAQLKPKVNVVGLIASCENMPGGGAVKPGDVVTSMSGQTIEILNTDAEGRLILCDALTYAERFKPHSVVDIATLTGACVIALGAVRSGLFASDEALADALLAAGRSSQDLCWRMPLDDEYAEGLKSNFADVANVAGRAGGSITAAKFLQRFATKYPWAHLDIAGTAWKSGAAKGSTGRPVGLLLDYLLSLQASPVPAPRVATRKKAAA
jgi:leucyl aminopeptidase